MIKKRKRIVFVEDEIDLKILYSAKKLGLLDKDDFGNLLVICCNYGLIAQAKEVFDKVRYIFEVIDAGDIQYRTYLEAKKSALIFLEKTGQPYKYLHYSLLPHLQETFYNILVSESFIKRTIEITGSNSLVLLPQRKIPPITFYAEFGFGPKNGIFGAVLEKISQHKEGIETKKIPWILGILCAPQITRQFLPNQFIMNWVFLIGRAIVKRKQPISRKISVPARVPPPKEKRESIIVNWGNDLRRYADLPDFSENAKGLKIVHLLFQKETLPALPPNHYLFSKDSLRSYLIGNLGTLFAGIFGGLAECLSVLKKDALFQKFYGQNFFFAYFFLYLYGTAIIEAYRKWMFSVFSSFSPKIFITSDLRNCIGRNFIFTAREKGAQVYTFSHGCPLFTPWIDPGSALGDKILVSGQSISANIQGAGIDKERIFIVGGKKKKLLVSPCPKKKNQKMVAIITAMKENSWIETRDLFSVFKTIEALVDEFSKSGFKVVIKSHKIADYWEFYDALVEQYKNFSVEHIKRRWTPEEFRLCDAVVFPGGVSSPILDSQAAGIPVIYVDILSKTEKEILNYDYLGCGAVVKNAQEAIVAAEKLFTDKNYFERILKKGKQFYESHFDAKKDFTKELVKLLKISGERGDR